MTVRRMLLASAAGLALAWGAGGAAAQDQDQVEVLHWWTSGGDRRRGQGEVKPLYKHVPLSNNSFCLL